MIFNNPSKIFFIIILLFSIASYFGIISFSASGDHLQVDETPYSIEVGQILFEAGDNYPFGGSDSKASIYVRVFDKYSEIKNATLSYSTDNWNSSNNIKMQPINGVSSNGTY